MNRQIPGFLKNPGIWIPSNIQVPQAVWRKVTDYKLEPDEWYCLGELHEVPDIALEIVLTSGGIDRLKIYQGLGVKAVMRKAFESMSKDRYSSDRQTLQFFKKIN
jgi:hypothetical protein